MRPSYREPFVRDKICAKSLKQGKKEVSTHVFGSFNAQKAEGLIAPQHFKNRMASPDIQHKVLPFGVKSGRKTTIF